MNGTRFIWPLTFAAYLLIYFGWVRSVEAPASLAHALRVSHVLVFSVILSALQLTSAIPGTHTLIPKFATATRNGGCDPGNGPVSPGPMIRIAGSPPGYPA